MRTHALVLAALAVALAVAAPFAGEHASGGYVLSLCRNEARDGWAGKREHARGDRGEAALGARRDALSPHVSPAPPPTPHHPAATPATLGDLLALDTKSEAKVEVAAPTVALPVATVAPAPTSSGADAAAEAAAATAAADAATHAEFDAAFGRLAGAMPAATTAPAAAATAAPATPPDLLAARTASEDGRPLCPATPSAVYQCVPPGFTPDAAPDLRACVDLCGGPPAPPLPIVAGAADSTSAAAAAAAAAPPAMLCLPCADPGKACKKAHGEFGNAFTYALLSRGSAPCYLAPPAPAPGDSACKNEGANNAGCGNVGDNNRVREKREKGSVSWFERVRAPLSHALPPLSTLCSIKQGNNNKGNGNQGDSNKGNFNTVWKRRDKMEVHGWRMERETRASLSPLAHTHTQHNHLLTTQQGDRNVGSYNQGNCNRGDGNNVRGDDEERGVGASAWRERKEGRKEVEARSLFSTLAHLFRATTWRATTYLAMVTTRARGTTEE